MANKVTQRDKLYALYDQGFRPSSPEAKKAAPNSHSRWNRWSEWRKMHPEVVEEMAESGFVDQTGETPEGELPPGVSPDMVPGNQGIFPGNGKGRVPHPPKQGILKGVLPGGGPIAVGKITITPQNWGIDQAGALKIIEVYTREQQEMHYGGTIGDFLVDLVTAYQRLRWFQEVLNARQTGSEGTNGGGHDGAESLEDSGIAR